VPIDASELHRIGVRLRALRQAAGETQEQTSAAVGLTRTYLTEIEAGRKNITLSTFYALAHHFEVDPADVLRIE
jgi:transcriptional regulator with XRE-family HTH domain